MLHKSLNRGSNVSNYNKDAAVKLISSSEANAYGPAVVMEQQAAQWDDGKVYAGY